MEKFLEFLKGKKTYAVVAIAIGGAILGHYQIFVIPEYVWIILAGLGLGASRAATAKIQKALDEANQ